MKHYLWTNMLFLLYGDDSTDDEDDGDGDDDDDAKTLHVPSLHFLPGYTPEHCGHLQNCEVSFLCLPKLVKL